MSPPTAHIVDHTQTGGGCELGPVGGPFQPVQVLPEEYIAGGPVVHKTIGYHCGIMSDGVPTRILEEEEEEEEEGKEERRWRERISSSRRWKKDS